MKPIDKVKDLTWNYHGKQHRLVTMNKKQLRALERRISLSANQRWFGIYKDSWLNAIREIRKSTKVVDQVFSQFKNGTISISNLQIK